MSSFKLVLLNLADLLMTSFKLGLFNFAHLMMAYFVYRLAQQILELLNSGQQLFFSLLEGDLMAKSTIFPHAFFQRLSVLAVQGSLSFLFSVEPVTLVYFSGAVSEDSVSLFFPMDICSLIGGSIIPRKFAVSMKLAVIPVSSVLIVIGVSCDAMAVRDECAKANLSLILFTLIVGYSRLVFWVVVQVDCAGFCFIIGVVDDEISSDGL